MGTNYFSPWHFAIAGGFALLLSATSSAQFNNNAPGQNGPNIPNAAILPGGQQNGFLFGPNANGNMGQNGTPQRGAAANADFDSLIDLIQSTVATDTWMENGGGSADIRPFPNGVLVDAGGMLRLKSKTQGASDLTAKRGAAPPPYANQPRLASKASTLRFVSLPRLEREIARGKRRTNRWTLRCLRSPACNA